MGKNDEFTRDTSCDIVLLVDRLEKQDLTGCFRRMEKQTQNPGDDARIKRKSDIKRRV